VDGVSFALHRGETLGLVGESGSGKTTLGRAVLRLVEPTAGEVLFQGERLLHAPARRLRELRRKMQLVFQDPLDSLNPRMTVKSIVAEGLLDAVRSRAERTERCARILERVGLEPALYLGRYPHEISGGQRQRVGIARALVTGPELLVCDEAVSSLDVSLKAQIVNLLVDLQAERGHACIFITHDLGVVRHVADRVAVMYLGRLAEIGPADRVCTAPHHPYTHALLASAPAAHPRDRGARRTLEGDPPSPIDPPRGCRFHPRCPVAFDRCRVEEPPPRELAPGHVSWCHLDAAGGAAPSHPGRVP
jgi:oligopeptide/dipeptide ABC transporter ATP-binding protein